jgi:hypothetical protein
VENICKKFRTDFCTQRCNFFVENICKKFRTDFWYFGKAQVLHNGVTSLWETFVKSLEQIFWYFGKVQVLRNGVTSLWKTFVKSFEPIFLVFWQSTGFTQRCNFFVENICKEFVCGQGPNYLRCHLQSRK